ncbi:MAG: response regulator [Endomicrobiales bacterium]|nr:response regulator [Endomicrobiales bacterium]
MSRKILIADDEDEIIEFIKAAFHGQDFKIVTTSVGSRVPVMIREEKPDLVFLDVMMPGLDGYSLVLQLSEKEETSKIPIVVMTALPASRQLFEKFGQVKHFVDKPFDAREMVKKAKEILK